MIVFLCQDSEPFENRYGESPKYVVDPDSDGIDTPDAKIDQSVIFHLFHIEYSQNYVNLQLNCKFT